MVTVQVVAVPEQPPPLQPPKVEGAVGLAVRVTGVFSVKAEVQVGPQSMPAGELITVPVPVPDLFMIRV